jgi:hypothetical protein
MAFPTSFPRRRRRANAQRAKSSFRWLLQQALPEDEERHERRLL